MKKERKPLQATTFRSILISVVVISLVVAGIGFYFGLSWLKTYAQEVNGVVKQAGQSGLSLGSLDGLQSDLAGRQEIIKKVNGMFAPANNFQSRAITDINTYASRNRISIADISLSATPDTANPNAASTLTVTFNTPPSYRDLLTFITHIQNNTPKMQVSEVNIGRIADGDGDKVKIESINIVVATR